MALYQHVYQYSLLTADAQTNLAGEVIISGRLGAISGVHVPRLESRVAARIGRAHAVATCSATAALEITLRALGVGPGSEVVVPALGWVSVGAAVASTGATVRVAPVDERLTPPFEQIMELLSSATAAVVIAHLRGMLAFDIARIATELERRGIPLIEDCAQAWGVRGAGSYGAAAFFSTQSHKLIATGEGGIIVCDDTALAATMRALAGDTRIRMPTAAWRGNARMPEISAALAIPQLELLDELLERLRLLQRPTSELLGKVGRPVLPEDFAASNGTRVGVWCDAPEAASALAARLDALGLLHWRPTLGDLHTCEAWPVRAGGSSPGWERYLDIQIPYAEGYDDQQEFLNLLDQAVTSVEGDAA
ncbi:DegT/DnrJ/EryC1/StrS family aminotransferase [Sphaerimonospora sp. CA-214678]|uniref:DegT/DnrJ/EryC1/StrS family aminotransferase n=1 Tax=Sphaerimonospora sp. CA-214678 TaxID=3240029 RepID=UPI003D9415B3